MRLKTKAINNLFLFHFYDQTDASAQAYTKSLFGSPTTQDFRQLSEEELFSRLQELGTGLEKMEFFQLANMVDNPETATKLLIDTAKIPPIFESVYLLVFELWRRFLPERQTLSIFCDELDRQIFLYNQASLKNDESLQKLLGILEAIFQENTDAGEEIATIRRGLDQYMAHDLDHFLYEYIADLIRAGSLVYAEELLESFYYYMHDVHWFTFLFLQITYPKDPIKAQEQLRCLIQDISKEPDLDLQLEILHFMVEIADRKSFFYLVEKSALILRTEDDFTELLEIVSDYYHRLDQEHIYEKIEQLLEKRAYKKGTEKFVQKTAYFQEFVEIVGLFR